jgi:hypothetical protein
MLGGDSIAAAVAILNLLWVPLVVFGGLAIPETILTLPTTIAFLFSLLHFVVVYRLRVARARSATGALFAAMSLQWTIAKAVAHALIGRDQRQFDRTAKGGRGDRGVGFSAYWEATLGGLLVIGAVIVAITNHDQIRENYFFGAALLVQSLPFLSAAAIAALGKLAARSTALLAVRISKSAGVAH